MRTRILLDPLITRGIKLAGRGLSDYVESRRKRGALPFTARVLCEKDIAYAPSGGKQSFDVYLPKAADSEPDRCPFLLFVHGGGWIAGDRRMSAVVGHVLAGNGLAVVAVGYRLAPRFHLGQQRADVELAIRFVLDNANRWRLDPHRWALGGESAGAYLAMRAAQEYPADLPRPRAIAGIYGFYDLASWLRHRNLPASGFMLRAVCGRQSSHAFVEEHSAMRRLPWSDVPVLLLHGEADRLAPHHHSRRLANVLREQGVQVELDSYPGVGHAFIYRRRRHPREVERAFGTILRFLRSSLEGDSELTGDDGA